MNIHRQTLLMLMNTINKFEQPNTEQADRRCAFSRSFTRMFDRLCAFLDERIGGASELIDACQSVADRFWHSKLYFPVCFRRVHGGGAAGHRRRAGHVHAHFPAAVL